MKYYYLNCEPSQRNIIKKHLQKRFESPYLIVDRLEDCNTMLVIGSKTPDMLNRRRSSTFKNPNTRSKS